MRKTLARDRVRIPAVQARDGLVPVTRTITGAALRESVQAKLSREPSAEELADVLEVPRALTARRTAERRGTVIRAML